MNLLSYNRIWTRKKVYTARMPELQYKMADTTILNPVLC